MGTFLALISIISPVCGFLPVRAFLSSTLNVPKPGTETVSLFLRARVMASKILSTAAFAPFLEPTISATSFTRSVLFIPYYPLCLRNKLDFNPHRDGCEMCNPSIARIVPTRNGIRTATEHSRTGRSVIGLISCFLWFSRNAEGRMTNNGRESNDFHPQTPRKGPECKQEIPVPVSAASRISGSYPPPLTKLKIPFYIGQDSEIIVIYKEIMKALMVWIPFSPRNLPRTDRLKTGMTSTRKKRETYKCPLVLVQALQGVYL